MRHLNSCERNQINQLYFSHVVYRDPIISFWAIKDISTRRQVDYIQLELVSTQLRKDRIDVICLRPCAHT